ncbi:MAG: UvrD-helicase domain-containing protein [bacterium]|nr:UvrD-helicase domain-containing protein [bacterium]
MAAAPAIVSPPLSAGTIPLGTDRKSIAMTLPSTSPMTSLDILQAYPLSDSQRRAALARDCDVAVTAGAGTGKTRTLVARYLTLLADGLPLRRIVAITFTRKAAREMRNRVRREIAAYLNQPAAFVCRTTALAGSLQPVGCRTHQHHS